jgi:antitoxin PrlF
VVLLLKLKVRILTMGYALTSKGQVTIPKHIREKLGVGPGDSVTFAANDRGEVVVQAILTEREQWDKALRESQADFKLDMDVEEWLDMTRGADRRDSKIDKAV